MKKFFLLVVCLVAFASLANAQIALLGQTRTVYPYVTSPFDRTWLTVTGITGTTAPIYSANDFFLLFNPTTVGLINANTGGLKEISPTFEGELENGQIIAAALDDENTIWVLIGFANCEITLRTLSLNGELSDPYLTMVTPNPINEFDLAQNGGKLYISTINSFSLGQLYIGNSTIASAPIFDDDSPQLIIFTIASPSDVPQISNFPLQNPIELHFDSAGNLITFNPDGELARYMNGIWDFLDLELEIEGSNTTLPDLNDISITVNNIIIGGAFTSVKGVNVSNIAAVRWDLNGNTNVFDLSGGVPFEVGRVTTAYDSNGAPTNNFYISSISGTEVHYWNSSTRSFSQVDGNIPAAYGLLNDIAARRPPVVVLPTPSSQPSTSSSVEPSFTPSASLSATPTVPPSEKPTEPPTQKPTEPPTQKPTEPPTRRPPTRRPTVPPSQQPTVPPSEQPTVPPSQQPTVPPPPSNPLVLFGPPNGWQFNGTRYDWGCGRCRYIPSRNIPDRLPLGLDDDKPQVTRGPAIRLKPAANNGVGCSNFFFPFLDLSAYNEIRFWYKSDIDTLFEFQVDNANKQEVRLGPASRWTQGSISLNFTPEQLKQSYGPLLMTAYGTGPVSRTLVANIIAIKR